MCQRVRRVPIVVKSRMAASSFPEAHIFACIMTNAASMEVKALFGKQDAVSMCDDTLSGLAGFDKDPAAHPSNLKVRVDGLTIS